MSDSSQESPQRCPVCGATALLEVCDPIGVVLCPRCGQLLRWFQGRLAFLYGATDLITCTSFAELGADSLDIVELVMEIEEQFDVYIPDDEVERIKTVGDAIRYIERSRRENEAAVVREGEDGDN